MHYSYGYGTRDAPSMPYHDVESHLHLERKYGDLHSIYGYGTRDAPSTSYHVVFLYVSASIFLLFEVYQMSGRRMWKYTKKPWNWFELTTVALVVTCTWRLFQNDSGCEGSIDDIHACLHQENGCRCEISRRRLLVTTGLFQFFHLISFLRNTFLPFARFVDGLIHVSKRKTRDFHVRSVFLCYRAILTHCPLDCS